MLTHVGTQRLETSRLILRRYKLSDAADMYQNWVTDPEVSRFWGWEPHKNIEVTKALLSNWVEEYQKQEYYHWVIVPKQSLQAVGYIYFTEIDVTDHSVSVHYALSRTQWGKGIMTEACTGVIDFAFRELHAEKVRSYHHIDNPASGRVLLKSGLRYLGTAYKDNTSCQRLSGDYCYYELTQDDWNR